MIERSEIKSKINGNVIYWGLVCRTFLLAKLELLMINVMKRIFYSAIFLVCLFTTTKIFGQNNALEAHYTKTLNITDEINGIEDVNVRQLVIDKYKKSIEYYTLYFNTTKYLFTKASISNEVELEGDGSLYTDMINSKNFAIRSIIDKEFIVENDMPKPIEWTIMSESTKQVLDMQCVKATTTDLNGNNIVAWFTAEIPSPTGPYGYCGLPGLILRLETKKETFEATSINYAPKEINVKVPNGKHVTQQEFSEIKEKKLKELGADPNQKSGVQVIKL